MSLKIGILIDRLDALSNRQLRIVDEILDNEEMEILVVSVSGSPKKTNQIDSVRTRFKNLFSGNLIGKALLALKERIEAYFFFKQPVSVNKA